MGSVLSFAIHYQVDRHTKEPLDDGDLVYIPEHVVADDDGLMDALGNTPMYAGKPSRGRRIERSAGNDIIHVCGVPHWTAETNGEEPRVIGIVKRIAY